MEGNDWWGSFNFTLLSGEKTNLDTGCEMTEERFDPDKVKKVELWWNENEGELCSIVLKDEENESILSIGSSDEC